MRLFASYNDFEFKLKYMMREIKDDILLIYIVLMFFRFNSVFQYNFKLKINLEEA